MGDEQQGPEPFETRSEKADVPPRADPSAEIVVLGKPPSTREEDATVLGGKESLQATIEVPTTPNVPTRQSATGPRFRILKPHARGGLGEVFVARDEELNRDVALKEIRGEHADNSDSRGRFLLEAEITGGLEHPGIVPVYGLGQYPDGRPYYAMRFIQGDSLKEAISAYHSPQGTNTADSERTLQLRKLLGRFVDVCQAVSYAHSRGVLHRDLKPGNIMLGKYGETLVVDWGLAKVQGRDDTTTARPDQLLQPISGDGVSPTLMGSALGTPAYMPPEQAAGKLDQLGPASDVYSLGATLYHLLTGRAPFKADSLEQTLRAVQSGTFPRPTDISTSVPRSLEAVCLKAMSLKHRDRYASPQDLADDIERWLADEPVQAFPEPLAIRARRWVRKHPTLTTTTAAVVLLSAVGLGTFSTILSGKNNQLTRLNDELGESYAALGQKNTALDQANTELTAVNAREVAARTDAERNELAAREQSQLAISTLTNVIFDVQKGIEGLPGGSDVRRRLLTTSLEKLEEVATEYVARATVDRNTLAALLDMGDVILQFGVGDEVEQNSLDESADAAELTEGEHSAVALAQSFYTRAHDIAAELAAIYPTNAEAQRDLALSYIRLGDVQLQLGDIQSARGFYQQYNDLCERLAAADTTHAEAQPDLAVSYDKLGNVSVQLGDTQSARGFYQQCNDTLERLAAADPTNARVQRDLSVSYGKLGDVQRQLGDTQSALVFYQQGLDINERLAAADPTHARAQRDLSVSYGKLGDVHQQLGDTQLALEFFQQSLDIKERQAAADPANAEMQRDLSVSYGRLGDVQRQLGDTQSARGFYQQCNQTLERLAAADPTNAQAQRDLSVSYDKLGDVSAQLGDTQLARRFFQQSLDINERLAAADPANAEVQRSLSVSFDRLGNVSVQLGDSQSARGFYQQLNDNCERLAAADPTNVEVQRDLAISYDKLGDVQRQLGDTQSARGFYQQGLDINERLAGADPTNVEAQRDLARSYNNLGDVHLRLGDAQAALEFYQQYNGICERLAAADPTNAEAQKELSLSYKNLGDVQLQLGDTQTALEFSQQSLDISERLAAADPTNARVQRELLVSYAKLGDVQRQLGETQSARGLYQQSLDIAERLAAADPANAHAQQDMMVSHYKLGGVAATLQDYETSLAEYSAAISVLDQMIADGQNVARSQQEREAIASEMRTVEREASQARAAVGDWESFIRQPGARSRLALRITLLARAGRFDEIPEAAAMLRSLDAENPINLHNAACGYAMCANAIQAAVGQSLTEEQRIQQQEYIDLAVACLREAITAGYSDFEHMQQDPDLAVLRDLPEFHALIPVPIGADSEQD